MPKSQHVTSVIGCALGFCAAGSGVGSVVGSLAGPWFFPTLAQGQGSPEERFMVFYGGTYWGIAVGMGVGFFAGLAYALLARRRLASPDAAGLTTHGESDSPRYEG